MSKIKEIIALFKKKKLVEAPLPEPTPKKERPIPFDDGLSPHQKQEAFIKRHIQRTAKEHMVGDAKSFAMDGFDGLQSGIYPASGGLQNTIPNSLMNWYGWQTFIGYQMCSILAQHWLVMKCCLVPARDAIRHGYEITKNDGEKLDAKLLNAIKRADIRYRIPWHMREFVSKGKAFGFRIAMFKVESDDPEYYIKPFNPDSITPGSYKGIVQIDPYWITPELDFDAGANPASSWFYEPTWWRVNAQRVHRTHLSIFRNGIITDLLKPTYLYGGIPVPQLIYERVYCAERTANEAPQLAMTKRTSVIKTNAAAFLANQQEASSQLAQFIEFRDNYGTKILDTEDTYEQHDVSLADFDAVIMSQYQLVAAAANIPATKLLGTTPKGFNSTGEYDETSYHEELESMQENDLTPLLERHHMLLILSEIAPRFGLSPFETSVTWNSLDSRTAKETAELNKLKAETDERLIMMGVINADEARKRIINDAESGYNGIEEDIEVENAELGGDPDEDIDNPFEENLQTDPDEDIKQVP